MVVTGLPATATAGSRQAFVRLPSTRTVQAPHWPWSQPLLAAGEIQLVAQGVQQGEPVVGGERVFVAVHLERDRARGGAGQVVHRKGFLVVGVVR
jgi:hypothetical protein